MLLGMWAKYLLLGNPYGLVYCILLSQFLWKRSTSEISKLIEHFWQVGLFVILVTGTIIGLNWWLYYTLLAPQEISSFSLMIVPSIIASGLYGIRNIWRNYTPTLYELLKQLWPLLLLEGLKLGFFFSGKLQSYDFITAIIFGVGFAVGWGLHIIIFAGIREHLSQAKIPKILDGFGISAIIVVITRLSIMGFAGLL